ncbi:MAG: sulfite exporter TauE/SafE family protein [Alphaproteobacteria bacterium]
MHLDYSIATLWPFALGLLFSGLCAGVLAGLLGVGGGIVIVPVLYHVFTALGIDQSVRMKIAVATSFAVILPTAIRSLRSHAKRGAVDFALLRSWAAPLFIFTLVGTVLAGFASSQVLTGIFATAALVVAAHLAFGREEWRIGKELPKGVGKYALAGSIGGISAVMGIGGGTFAVPAMTLYGYPIHKAVATSSGLGIIISVPGIIGYIISGWHHPNLPPLSLGYVNLLGFLLITPTTVLTAPLGVAFAHALPRKRLIQAFALFLALTSIKMFMGLFKG